MDRRPESDGLKKTYGPGDIDRAVLIHPPHHA